MALGTLNVLQQNKLQKPQALKVNPSLQLLRQADFYLKINAFKNLMLTGN